VPAVTADQGRPAPSPIPADGDGAATEDTGHPAVDAVLRSLANAARLAPGEQIAAYEAAHEVLQETLASIDR
jgi:NADPH-dependent curcumin reductase CurA